MQTETLDLTRIRHTTIADTIIDAMSRYYESTGLKAVAIHLHDTTFRALAQEVGGSLLPNPHSNTIMFNGAAVTVCR